MTISKRKPLEPEIKAFVAQKDELEKHHMGKWAVFQDGKLYAVYDTYENALFQAASNFGSGPYLIRQVGAEQTNISMARINKFTLASS